MGVGQRLPAGSHQAKSQTGKFCGQGDAFFPAVAGQLGSAWPGPWCARQEGAGQHPCALCPTTFILTSFRRVAPPTPVNSPELIFLTTALGLAPTAYSNPLWCPHHRWLPVQLPQTSGPVGSSVCPAHGSCWPKATEPDSVLPITCPCAQPGALWTE